MFWKKLRRYLRIKRELWVEIEEYMVNSKEWSYRYKYGGEEYWITTMSIASVTNLTQKRKHDKLCNYQYVYNKDGTLKTNRCMSPFSGRWYDVPEMECDVISLSISPIKRLNSLPIGFLRMIQKDLGIDDYGIKD